MRLPDLISLGFSLFLAVSSHLLFSPYGFSPSDDGVVLAGSQRILNGQVPHRDFVSIRPPGSFYLHVPEAVIGGENALLASRLVFWLEACLIAWCWLRILIPTAGILITLCLLVISFTFSVHTFQAMAWHTLDALLFSSIGLLLLVGNDGKSYLGWLLLGASLLFRQNFLFLAAGTAVIFLLVNPSRHFMAVAVPGIIFLAFLAVSGSLDEAVQQLTVQTSFYQGGIKNYVTEPLFYAGLIAGAAMAAGLLSHRKPARQLSMAAITSVPFLGAAALLAGRFHFSPSIGLFGIAAGLIVTLALLKKQFRSRIPEILALLCAWTASVSLGYSTPALLSGALALVIIGTAIAWNGSTGISNFTVGMIVSGTAALLLAFIIARTKHIYREKPRQQLVYSLSGILPGGKGIFTNKEVHDMLNEAKAFSARQEGAYSILPDMAAWWIHNEDRNPMVVDRAVHTEMFTQEERVRRSLKTIPVIMQKYSSKKMAKGLIPVEEDTAYAICGWIRKNFRLVESGTYFEVYSPQR